MIDLRPLTLLCVALGACASDELARQPPLIDMQEPLELLMEPDDEVARRELALGSFTGLVVGDARASLDAMLDEPAGVSVLSVVENSPADAAGLTPGDLLVAVRRKELVQLRWPSEWRRLEQETEPGSRLVLVVDRAGAEFEAQLGTVARLRPAERQATERWREEDRVGVVLRTATEVEARAAALGPGGGAVVVGLSKDSPWRAAGVVYRDLVRAVDGVEVAHPGIVLERVRAAPEDGAVELEIVRNGRLVALRAPVSQRSRELTEFSIPLVFTYEKDRDQSETSLLLGLFYYASTPAAWRLRLLWFLSFSGGDADRLESLTP
jgi:C-terminal processing protease CtpA/Prc